jgi:hypothetical protein
MRRMRRMRRMRIVRIDQKKANDFRASRLHSVDTPAGRLNRDFLANRKDWRARAESDL